MEYELLDTGIFNEDRYFDVFVEYAKATPDDILIQISAPIAGLTGSAASVAHPLVPEQLDLVAGHQSRPEANLRQKGEYQVVSDAPSELGERYFTAKEMCRCSSPKMRRTMSGFSLRQKNTALRQGRHQQLRGARETECSKPRSTGTKAAAHYQI